MTTKSKLNIIVDNVGRTIIGSVKTTTSTIEITDPAIINIQTRPDTGQIAVQLIPYLFREFIPIEKRKEPQTWVLQKSSVAIAKDLEIDDNLKNQYNNVLNSQRSAEPAPNVPPPENASTEGEEQEVVKLFDD